jgi:hypothetical protein
VQVDLLSPSHNLKKGAAGSTYRLPHIPEERTYNFTTAITYVLTILLLLLCPVRYISIQHSTLKKRIYSFPTAVIYRGLNTDRVDKQTTIFIQSKRGTSSRIQSQKEC